MRRAVKALARALAALVILPALGLYWLGVVVSGPGRALPGWSQALALLPGTMGSYLRVAFYRITLARCESNVSIGFGTLFSHPGASLGRGVYVGPYCIIGDVELGDDVLLASFVSITNGVRQHGTSRLDLPIRMQPGCWPRITIGPDTWIGERAVVMADIGAHCVVGAGAVVTRAIPDYAIAVGVPARVIRYRNMPEGETIPCPTQG